MNAIDFDKEDLHLAEIAKVAATEPIGSFGFFLQFGLLALGAIASGLILGVWFPVLWWAAYFAAFMTEKAAAAFALRRRLARLRPAVLGLMAARASIYNVLAVYFWTLEEPVFQMGTLVMVVGSTLNTSIHQGRFATSVACVAVPNALLFVAIAWLIYLESGFAAPFWGAVVATICILPYYAKSVLTVTQKWRELERVTNELNRSQRIESIGRLTGGVAHDFNNILSVILGSLELMRDAKDPRERTELIDGAIKATENGSELTSQMLAISRRSPLVPRTIDLNEAIASFADMAVRVLPASIKLDVHYAEQPVPAAVDPNMLQSALINLAMNSKDAMPSGGVLSVEVRRRAEVNQEPGRDRMCAIVVSDKGAGISDDDLSRVFEPFFTTKELGAGSGLGLSMVKGFVEQSGGQIDVESQVGSGTSVTLTLPISGKAIDAAPVRNQSIPPAQQARLFIVEDNQDLRALLARKLSRSGFDVVPFENGDEAARAIEQADYPDVLVSDMVMPGKLQGSDLARLARAQRPDLPIVLMSGYAASDDGRALANVQADAFVQKPVRFEELVSLIRKLLDKWHEEKSEAL